MNKNYHKLFLEYAEAINSSSPIITCFVSLMKALPEKCFGDIWEEKRLKSNEKGDVFHKYFRKTDMYGNDKHWSESEVSAHLDLAVWNLMQSGEVYRFLFRFIDDLEFWE